jgi:hypothetical protein
MRAAAIIVAALALAGCAVNTAYPPIVGDAVCTQFAEHESANPFNGGGMGYAIYDCSNHSKVYSAGAWPTSSFTSQMPATVIGGAASATVPMLAK